MGKRWPEVTMGARAHVKQRGLHARELEHIELGAFQKFRDAFHQPATAISRLGG